MKFIQKIKAFFTPAPEAKWWQVLAPYGLIVLIFIAIGVGGSYGWEYTNSPEFCGETCHTMPPSYNTYLNSPHAQVKCVECHIGRDSFGSQLTRKAGDFRHVTAMLFTNYEYPIHIKSLRPAEEVCEQCHTADKFSEDTILEIAHYGNDRENTLSMTYLKMNTGGGSASQGLGKGIHWHTQNDVWYYATDELEQEIPYIKVTREEIGVAFEYVDIDSGFDPYSIQDGDLVKMDCITCHNRISHQVLNPNEAVDLAMQRGQIAAIIPEIRGKGVELLSGEYASSDEANASLGSLDAYYRENYTEFYDSNADLINTAISQLKKIYSESVYELQEVDWTTHPNNLGHSDAPGCFRCHDGEHYDFTGRVIPVECNACHSVPLVVTGDEVSRATLPLGIEEQPVNHALANWMILHPVAFDEQRDAEHQVCSQCHDTTAYDTADNISFCSNAACHGSVADSLDFVVEEDISSSLFRGLIQQLAHYPSGIEAIAEWLISDNPDVDAKFHMLDQIHGEAIYEHPDNPENTSIECQDCHDPYPPKSKPSNETCLKCHGNDLIGWANLTAGFEPNPHDGHYGDIACYDCHKNFGPYNDPCGLCHSPESYAPLEGSTGPNN